MSASPEWLPVPGARKGSVFVPEYAGCQLSVQVGRSHVFWESMLLDPTRYRELRSRGHAKGGLELVDEFKRKAQGAAEAIRDGHVEVRELKWWDLAVPLTEPVATTPTFRPTDGSLFDYAEVPA